MKTYNHLNEYYKEKFNERTLKICIDASFTCPNRDGKKGKEDVFFVLLLAQEIYYIHH